MITAILHDAVYAAIAGTGFGAMSNPPKRAFPFIAILSAMGHVIRFLLMHSGGLDLASATLFGALAVGLGSFIAGGRLRCPMPVISIPSMLPMVPGIPAYKAVFCLITFLRHSGTPQSTIYLQGVEANFLIALTTTFCLAVGVTMPYFIFRRRALLLARRGKPGTPAHGRDRSSRPGAHCG